MALTAQSNQATPENSGTPGGVQKDCKSGGDPALPSPSYVTTKIKTEPGRISKVAEEGRPTLPPSLESIQKSDYFPTQRHRWNTNEEIAAILISFDKHEDWLSKEVKIRPKSGSMLLYSRKRVRYRRDGYCWKKRKDGKTTREDHMKLKVQGTECIYGCYVHSAILPTFHRRCYWLLQNPDVVLVHYLNVPYSDDNKLLVTPSLSYCSDKKEWTKEELVSQLKPMFFSESEPNLNNELEISTAETVEAIVQQLMEKQHSKTSVRTHECPCDSTTKPTPTPTTENKRCTHTLHRIISPKTQQAAIVGAPTSTAEHPTKVIAPTAALVSRATEHKYATAAQTVSSTPEVTSVPAPPRTSNVILAAPCRQILHDGRQVEASAVPVARSATTASTTASLILSLSQLQGGGGLLILNSTTSAAGVELTPASMTPVTLLYGREPVTTSTAVSSQNSSAVSKSNTVITSNSITSALHLANSVQEDKVRYEDQMDNVENVHIGEESLCDIVEQKEPELSSTSVDPSSESKDSSHLFDETIHMSEDDMHESFTMNQQETKPVFSNLSNLNTQISIKSEPLHSDSDPVDLNPMDFIDNDISTPDEEIFNLDTFDMLTDLPNLDDLNTDLSPRRSPSCSSSTLSSRTSLVMNKLNPENSRAHHALDYREGTANITDYSPDWSYTEGGVKVLVAGPWYSTTSPYTIIFDGVSVPTALVQTGVLRCYCPAHEAGLVTLQVACEGFVISNSVIFEYRECPAVSQQKTDDWFGIDDGTLKFCLLERLEMLETRVNLSQQDSISRMSFKVPQQVANKQYPFEDRLVLMCHKLINASWLPGEDATAAFQNCTRSNLSILHLASALGYSRLVCTLLHWRAENPSIILDSQVDAFSQDTNDCTPLIWACARGHKEVALLLYQWNRAAMNLRDRMGRSPIDVSRERGCSDIADEIEQLEKARLSQSSSNSSSSSSLLTNSSTCTVLNSYLPDTTDNSKHQKVHIQDTFNKCSSSSDSNSVLGLDSLGMDGSVTLLNEERKLSVPTFRSGESRKCCNPDCNELVGMSEEEDNVISVNTVDSSGSNHRESYGNCDLTISSSSGPEAESRVLALAEHIIAAMPDRIKASSSPSDMNGHGDSTTIQVDGQSCLDASSISNILHSPIFSDESDVMEVVSGDVPPSALLSDDCNADFNDQTYRYCDVSTPTSSLSPASSSCLQSPRSLNLESPSPPPSMADFCEYFQASGKVMEKDFSNLTLSDSEQRQLYEAAKIIQKAYRSYKGRKRQEESLEKERVAAILIQSYYRRYKQYMYYKQMTKAAQVIQNQYRSYCEHKRFKKNLENDGVAASTSSSVSASSSNIVVAAGPSRRVDSTVQSYYHHGFAEAEKRSDLSREGTPTSSALKRTFSQRRQHQAARKIQQFMRQSKNKLQKERASAAEREKSVVEPLAHLNQHPLLFQEHLSNITTLQKQ